MALAVFSLSLAGLFYVYLGYPLLVELLAALRPLPVAKGSEQPRISVLIAAYNESEVIAATVANKLKLDYPAELLEVIVVSDGSDDGTDDIVLSLGDPRVKLLRQQPRAGKTLALNMAVKEAAGEILIFSDANSLYDRAALRELVANFSDETVGYVTGMMIYTDNDGNPAGDGCSAYMKYENRLRAAESAIGSIVGVDGGIDAMRKMLYQPLNADQLPDFVQPLKVVEQGYRVVYEPEALLKEPSLRAEQDEYRMRVRVSLRAFWALFDMRQLLWGKDLLFAWQLWSHKLLRYLCFLFLAGALFSNLLLLQSGSFYLVFFFLQCAAYGSAIFATRISVNGSVRKLIDFSRYFALLNLASGHACVKFLLGQKQVVWTPRKG